jgi:hypothetical protein
MNYNLQCVQSYAKISEVDSNKEVGDANSVVPTHGGHYLKKSSADGMKRSISIVSSSPENTETFDIDNFLDQLGPRYRDWSGRNPIPVDADLLPGVVPGYKPPFRLLPYKMKSTLRNKEMTSLRGLARQTAPHFALGIGVCFCRGLLCQYHSIFNEFELYTYLSGDREKQRAPRLS